MQTKVRISFFALAKFSGKFVGRFALSICVISPEPRARWKASIRLGKKTRNSPRHIRSTCHIMNTQCFKRPCRLCPHQLAGCLFTHPPHPSLYRSDEHPLVDWLPEDIPEPLSTSWAKLLFRKICDPTDPLLLKPRLKLILFYYYLDSICKIHVV